MTRVDELLNRRELLELAASTGATIALSGSLLPAAEEREHAGASESFEIIDTNVSLFQWPFRRLPLDEPQTLARKLQSLGVTQAWAGSFEAILHRDLTCVNQRLVDASRDFPALMPIGAINPTLPGWEDDLRCCVEDFRMVGVRLLPGYHGYSLDDARFAELLKQAAEAGVFVQIAASLEDTRTQSEQVRVPDVDLTPLVGLLPRISKARVQILNHRLRAPLLTQLGELPGVYFDTARVDGTDAVPTLVQNVPSGRVLFGSHAPFLIPEAALIRTHESSQLNSAALQAVLAGNAQALLEKTR